MKFGRRTGFTLIELVIVIALLAIVLVKLTLVVKEASNSHRRETTSMALEDRALHVLDQIAYAVMGAERESLNPDVESPFFSTDLRYQVSLGVEDGELVWSEPEEVALSGDERQVLYGQNMETANERIVVWTNAVSPFFGNEIPNGEDDNDNELTDESGLTFVVDGSAITIRLTLQSISKEGRPIQATVETFVTCRN